LARVLVVDDEESIRYLMRLVFELNGYEVDEAPNGAAALQRVSAAPPDVIVTDVMMPVMNGRELIAHLRADPSTASIPIIVVSSSISVNAISDGDRAFQKPFDQTIVVDAADELLGVDR
jgi:CheY-like chemotaxis protein